MPQSVVELHATYPYDRDEKAWNGQVPFDTAAELAGDLHLQEDPLAYLETIAENDYVKGSAINHSLLLLPPRVLLDNFGEEVAVWTSVNAHIMGDNEEINTVLKNEAGYDITDLEAARLWSWQKHFRSGAREIIAQYRLMRLMREGLVDQVDLPKILIRCALGGIALSSSRIDQYGLIPIEIDHVSSNQFGGGVKNWYGERGDNLAYHMYLDVPTGFALTYKGLPNAMGGVAMNGTDELRHIRYRVFEVDA